MQILKLKKGDYLARKGEKVGMWFIIQSGQIIQSCRVEELLLKENFVIGMLEEDYFWCDYISRSDSTLLVLPKLDHVGLKRLFAESPQFRSIFLSSTIMHKHRELTLYSSLFQNTRGYYDKLQELYNTYKLLCEEFALEEQKFPEFSNLVPVQLAHKAEGWEVNQSNSLMRGMLTEYLSVVEKDEDMTVGSIMECGRSLKRICQGIDEMDSYLFDQKDILLAERGMDIFRLFFDLSVRTAKIGSDYGRVKRVLDELIEYIKNLDIYDESLVASRVAEYINFDYSAPMEESSVDARPADHFGYIMEYAGYDPVDIDRYRYSLKTLAGMPDGAAADKNGIELRKQVSDLFFEVYEKCFYRSIEEDELPAAVLMFMNFGVLDDTFLSDEQSEHLFAYTRRLSRFNTDHVHTLYDWLRMVYNIDREPSRNEFDLDFEGFLKQELKEGNIDELAMKKLRRSRKARVNFEIHNLFESGQRISYGRLTTYVPMLRGTDLINSVARMAVTAEKIDDAINEVRAVDFSLLYRPVPFEDQDRGIKAETIQKEVMPDVILLPVCGMKAVMWQETSGVKRDSPARLVFPIFTIADISSLMLENMGRYRWELTRRLQGQRWNDISDRSLTSEYFDYLQYYRKNQALSPEVRERIKNSLVRAKNNFRELFVQDYINWIKYESAGGFRLNKVSRGIMVKYCPFAKSYRKELRNNPMFRDAFDTFESEQAKSYTHFRAVNDRIEKAGGRIPQILRDNLVYYEL